MRGGDPFWFHRRKGRGSPNSIRQPSILAFIPYMIIYNHKDQMGRTWMEHQWWTLFLRIESMTTCAGSPFSLNSAFFSPTRKLFLMAVICIKMAVFSSAEWQMRMRKWTTNEEQVKVNDWAWCAFHHICIGTTASLWRWSTMDKARRGREGTIALVIKIYSGVSINEDNETIGADWKQAIAWNECKQPEVIKITDNPDRNRDLL